MRTWQVFFKRFYLFIYSWQTRRERQRHKQREKQAPCKKPNAGLDPRTLGSRPEPKADAPPLSPSPRLPILTEFLRQKAYKQLIILVQETWTHDWKSGWGYLDCFIPVRVRCGIWGYSQRHPTVGSWGRDTQPLNPLQWTHNYVFIRRFEKWTNPKKWDIVFVWLIIICK